MSRVLNIDPPECRAPSSGEDNLLGYERRILRSYDREARVYDRKRFESEGGRLTAELQERTIVDLLCPRPGQRILDVAAGTGRITSTLVRSGADVTAADLSGAMLGRMRDRLEEGGLPPAAPVRANARLLPFADGTFDAVVSIRFLHLIPVEHQRAFLEEMRRVVRPGGRILVEFANVFFGGPLGFIYHALTKGRQGERMAGRLLPHREKELFRGFDVIARAGSIYPGAGRVAKLGRHRALALRKAWYRFPLNHLTLTFMVLCRV